MTKYFIVDLTPVRIWAFTFTRGCQRTIERNNVTPILICAPKAHC